MWKGEQPRGEDTVRMGDRSERAASILVISERGKD